MHSCPFGQAEPAGGGRKIHSSMLLIQDPEDAWP